MLSSFTKFIYVNNRILRVAVRLNHLNSKTDKENKLIKSDVAIRNDFKERLMKVSNEALTRYNEIIGFHEIDQEYKKISELQVN